MPGSARQHTTLPPTRCFDIRAGDGARQYLSPWMTAPTLGDHLAGGYLLVRSSRGSPPWMPHGFGVTRAISASEELVPAFPRPTWGGDFDALATKFGLGVDERAAAGKRADELFDAGRLGWPNVFVDRADATEFRQSFASGREDVVVLGIGLVEQHAAASLEGIVRSGVTERLERRGALEKDGRALGYELLGLDVPPLVSWAVNHLPALVHDRLAIPVNEDGLIASFDDACSAAELISRPEVPSEPLRWWPWLLVEYP